MNTWRSPDQFADVRQSSLHRRRTATGRSYRRRCTCSRTGGSGSRPAHHRTRSTSSQGRLGCSPRSL